LTHVIWRHKIRNVTIRQQTGLEETSIKEIKQNQLTCYGRVQRMAEGGLPKKALKWLPKQKRARRKPKNWLEGIKKATNRRNLKEGHWEDREYGVQVSDNLEKHFKTGNGNDGSLEAYQSAHSEECPCHWCV
jgi:hypothetical protein